MSEEEYEAYLVVIGRKNGQRHAQRHQLNVPVGVARGHLENVSDMQLRWLMNDIRHEQERRRTGGAAVLANWNPDNTQVRAA